MSRPGFFPWAQVVRFLLDRDVDANAAPEHETTPLLIAIRNGHEEARKTSRKNKPLLQDEWIVQNLKSNTCW